MDHLQYEQYVSVLKKRQLSLDALKRIIKHDQSHGYNDPKAMARNKVLEDCLNSKITSYKLYDDKEDVLYGNKWPLPLTFTRSNNKSV